MTITPEEIQANIARSQAHKRDARERDLAERDAAKHERDRERFPEYNGKPLGFVVKTRKGLYKPLIGRPVNSHGDNDSFIYILDSERPPQATLELALASFESDRDTLALVLEKPVPSLEIATWHWLAPMLACQAD